MLNLLVCLFDFETFAAEVDLEEVGGPVSASGELGGNRSFFSMDPAGFTCVSSENGYPRSRGALHLQRHQRIRVCAPNPS